MREIFCTLALLLGAYRFDLYKGEKGDRVKFTVYSERDYSEAVAAGKILAESTNFARDLVNTAPSDMTPILLAQKAAAQAELCGVSYEILGEREIEELLASYGDDGKEPNPMAKGMSWMKTNVRLVMNESDATIAGLMTDGCNMGVKSLGKYLNQYAAADEEAKDITRRLMALEEQLAEDVRRFL